MRRIKGKRRDRNKKERERRGGRVRRVNICSEPFARRGPFTRQLFECMGQAHSLQGLSSEREEASSMCGGCPPNGNGITGPGNFSKFLWKLAGG